MKGVGPATLDKVRPFLRVEVSAFPLFAHTDEFVGVIVIFWRR